MIASELASVIDSLDQEALNLLKHLKTQKMGDYLPAFFSSKGRA